MDSRVPEMESTPKIRSGQQFSRSSGDFSMFQKFRAQKREKPIFRPSISGPKKRSSPDFFLQCVHRGLLSRNQHQNPQSSCCISQKTRSSPTSHGDGVFGESGSI